MTSTKIPPGFQDMLSFPLIEALLGRRSRRFFMGAKIPDGVFAYQSSLEGFLENVRKRVRQLCDGRLRIPSEIPYTEAHNTWVFSRPSTPLVVSVGDLSQHVLLNVCYMLQNGLVLYDDINKRSIPGIERFREIVDVMNVWPITFVEQWSLSELTVELGTSCYAGTLMLRPWA
jgi:hypothetical protein